MENCSACFQYPTLVAFCMVATYSSQLHPSLENLVSQREPPCWRDCASFLCASSGTCSQSSLQPMTQRCKRLLLAEKVVHLSNPCSSTLVGIRKKLDSCWDHIFPKLFSLTCSGALIPSSIKHYTWILNSGSMGWKPHRVQRWNTPFHL